MAITRLHSAIEASTVPAPSPFIASLIFLTVILVMHRQYRSWKRLSHIPGPLAAHLSIFWFVRQTWNGKVFPTMLQAGEKYGTLVRVGPNLLICSDPDELRRISGTRTEYTKGPAYDALRVTDGEPHVVSQRDPVKHRSLRAKMGAAYSLDFQPAIDRQISRLVDLITRKYAFPYERVSATVHRDDLQPKSMDFGEKMHFYALDCIGDIAMGESFGLLDKDEDVYRIVEINDLSLRVVTISALLRWLVNLRSWWPFSYFLPKEGDHVGFGVLFGFAKDLVERRTRPEAKPVNDMMQAFIRNGMTKEQLMQQVYIHIIAGSDTTSNWARMAMICLLTCPPAYLALQREIDAASTSGRLSSPVATDAEIRMLPYLDAVLREAMRLHPSAVSPAKLCPQRGTGSDVDTVCGFTVPGGTEVGANIPGVLRSTNVFGHDAGCFRPERWLEAARCPNDNCLYRMKADLDLVFGAGKFQCLGKAISWMEVRKLLVELMRRFDFALINNIQPLRQESYGIMVVNNFNVRVTHRAAAPMNTREAI
ncbi:cytochrome P450 [Xylaria sp. FL0043]|nr:cytochrome P450 [Xylaria sp. FL0043]